MAGNLPDYPAPPGNKRWTVATITGPASYTQITTGTPPTGGQLVNASDIGLVDMDFAFPGISDNGQYLAIPIFENNPQRAATRVRVLWLTAATGAQVAGATNLSARTFRLSAFGN